MVVVLVVVVVVCAEVIASKRKFQFRGEISKCAIDGLADPSSSSSIWQDRRSKRTMATEWISWQSEAKVALC